MSELLEEARKMLVDALAKANETSQLLENLQVIKPRLEESSEGIGEAVKHLSQLIEQHTEAQQAIAQAGSALHQFTEQVEKINPTEFKDDLKEIKIRVEEVSTRIEKQSAKLNGIDNMITQLSDEVSTGFSEIRNNIESQQNMGMFAKLLGGRKGKVQEAKVETKKKNTRTRKRKRQSKTNADE